MSRNPDVAHAEAVAHLRDQLEAWGVPDPHDKAAEFVRGLVWEGWRPRGPRYEPSAPADGHRCPAEAAPEDYRRAREALRRNPEPETTEEQADA